MKRFARTLHAAASLGVMLTLNNGCAMFRASTHDVDVDQPKHFTAEFDHSDMRNITEDVVTDLLDSPVLTGKPIFMIAGIENRTSNYVDTKNLTDRMRTLIFNSGKAQFVNEARRADLLKEQGYQAAHATPETQTAIGKQLGAKFMLSGSLVEMSQTSPKQARISRQKLKYYKLTVEVTDLETGLIAWTTEKEFARQASLPLIGW